MKDQIRYWVLDVLSGHCFGERRPDNPRIIILSPWIKDVRLDMDKKFRSLDEEFFTHVYGISSINLPYALLAVKLDFGADIDIVTLPPTKKHHGERTSEVMDLLDFLDEIGCNVYTNDDLHSKLILSNDIALLGSFNLSFPALWGREEVGVSIDDLENMKILENYAGNVLVSSRPYGFTVKCRQHEFHLGGDRAAEEMVKILNGDGHITKDQEKRALERDPIKHNPINSVTRGWLLEEMVRRNLAGEPEMSRPVSGEDIREFHYFLLKPGDATSHDMIQLAASDLKAFYIRFLLAFRKGYPEKMLGFLKLLFNYQGKNEVGEVLDFLETKLARTHVPKISPIIKPFPTEE